MPFAALLLVFTLGCFALAMLSYGWLLFRLRRPVTFFDLGQVTGPAAALARRVRWLWLAAIGGALAHAAARVLERSFP